MPTKVTTPDIPKTRDKAIPTMDCTIPLVKPKGDIGTKVIDRKIVQDVNREIPVHRPPSKPVKISILEILMFKGY